MCCSTSASCDYMSEQVVDYILYFMYNVTQFFVFPEFQCEATDKADIVLLVDGSSSISSPEFKMIQSVLTLLVSLFNIGPDRVQIGTQINTL